MKTTSFLTDEQPLDPSRPDLGAVAVIPWDSEIFGFAVGLYRPGTLPAVAAAPEQVQSLLDEWQTRRGVELLSCRLKGADTGMVAALAQVEFVYVESSFAVHQPRLRPPVAALEAAEVRLAEWREHDCLLELAESVDFGRYHADARFPRALAARRYRWWLDNALTRPGAGTRVYVIGGERAIGFCHVEADTMEADLRLCGLDRRSPPATLFHLLSGVLRELRDLGIARVTARLSATDTGGMSVFAALGFHFGQPEIVLHRHWKQAKSLIPLPSIRTTTEAGETELTPP